MFFHNFFNVNWSFNDSINSFFNYVFNFSYNNVLNRFYYAAKKNKSSIIVRVCADNAFIDPEQIDDLITQFLKNKKCLISNVLGTIKYVDLEKELNRLTKPQN